MERPTSEDVEHDAHRPGPRSAPGHGRSGAHALGWLLAAGLAQGCSESAPDGAGRPANVPAARPNVVLICLDTTRADHLGAYGHPDDPTPRIDELAEGGVLFEQCACPVPLTLPSHASLFTGTYPLVHGVRDNGGFRLADESETLAEALARAGYATAAQVAVFLLNRESGMEQGFATYRDTSDAAPGGDGGPQVLDELTADVVAEGALRALRETAGRPFFLFVHFFDAHAPYQPPAGYAERFGRPGRDESESAYLGELAFIDEQVGRILDELAAQGLAESTLVALTADHGESFGEHQEIGHSYFVYDATTRVPLILRLPGKLPAGRRVPAQVRNIDLAPTILELCGVEPLPRAQGTSLAPTFGPDSLDPGHFAYLETLAPYLDYRYSPLRALRGAGWKYILAPRAELYDLRADPGETRDLHDTQPQVVATMRAKLEELVRSSAPLAGNATDAQVDPEEMERLRGLGYLGGGAGEVADLVDLEPRGADPKDRIREMTQASTAQHKMARGDWAEAARLFAGLLGSDPENPLYLFQCGEALLRLDEREAARAAFTRLVRVAPDHAGGHERLAQLAPDAETALPHLEALTRLVPDRPERFVEYGRTQALLRDLEGAQRSFERALALDPDHEGALLFTVKLHVVRGELASAARLLADAVERRPTSAVLLRQLAWLRATSSLDEVRDGAAALELCRRLAEVEAPPSATTALIEACALAELGRFEDALAELARSRELAAGAPDAVLLLQRAGALEELFRSGRPARTNEPL